jgi:hypothetical protein
VKADYENKGREKIRILLSDGHVTINRSVIKIEYSDEEGEKRTIREMPLDKYLHIERENLPFKASALALNRFAHLGQVLLPYKPLGALVVRELGIDITDSLIHDITDYVGSLAYKEDERKGQAWKSMFDEGKGVGAMAERVGKRGTRKGTYYIMLDGSMVNTRKSESWEGGWKEVKLALFFAASDAKIQKDGQTIRIGKKDYAVCLGSVEEFCYQVMEAAVRNHCFEYEELVVISDGATWIREMCGELFPDAVQILDFWHMAEHLYAYARYKFNNDETKYKAWAEARLDFMREGRWEEVLYSMKELEGETLPKEVGNPYTYLQNNRDKIDYAAYKAKGWYIGSGPMESSNKTVVQARMKQSGMRWNDQEARHMLALRTRSSANRWNEITQNLLNLAA